MAQPSTAWQEKVAPDEAERFARYAAAFAEMQRRKSERFGPGRALHRKQVLGLAGRLEVLPGLPEHARHGLFASPGSHDAWVRLSNGSADRAPDRRPDVRGFAVKVLGLRGPGALGGETTSQDFLLINHPAFAFPRSDEFVELVLAAGKGGGALLAHVFRRYGPVGGARFLARFARSIGRPFSGFATEPFYSAAPIACGPYAARVRLLPASTAGDPGRGRRLGRRLPPPARRRRPGLRPPAPVLHRRAGHAHRGRLGGLARGGGALPAPWPGWSLRSARPASRSTSRCRGASRAAIFDPWPALAAHRPLGDVMRARKVVYFASEKGRGAVPG